MKVAILSDHLDNIGGAEIVTLTLAKELNTDIYTTNFDPEKIDKMGFKDVLPRIHTIGKIPINAPFRQQLCLLRFRLLNLKNKYDFYIISGEWAISAVINNKPNLWYVHTPIRELWDLYEHTRENVVPKTVRPIFDMWVFFNRLLNKKYTKRANKVICNSINTSKRLEKFLNIKGVTVINPPIETNHFYYNKNGDFWLSVNRLTSAKKIDIQLNAFKLLPNEKLIIIGSYEKGVKQFENYKKYIEGIKPKNVEIKNWVSNDDLISLYANCKGFITTAIDEDFGMTPVEAMASGKPVIAPASGGYIETVVNNTTGRLIDQISPISLVSAIEDISNDPKRFKNECIKHSQKFSTKIFIDKIKKIMNYEE